MPTYEYKCENCGHQFEQFQSITSKPLRVCPQCGENKLNRLIGAGAGIIFKGSGFYQTDYRNDSYKKAAASDNKTSNKPVEKKETKPKESVSAEKSSSQKTDNKNASSG
ncbi:MAG: zinc ribbon domain-containing protein [Sedimentisphaerales bacterium]|nr:zinc ribbon domain-containing protein [Sedimentisphaerales bacterium]